MLHVARALRLLDTLVLHAPIQSHASRPVLVHRAFVSPISLQQMDAFATQHRHTSSQFMIMVRALFFLAAVPMPHLLC